MREMAAQLGMAGYHEGQIGNKCRLVLRQRLRRPALVGDQLCEHATQTNVKDLVGKDQEIGQAAEPDVCIAPGIKAPWRGHPYQDTLPRS